MQHRRERILMTVFALDTPVRLQRPLMASGV